MRVLITGSRNSTKLREIQTILDFLKALHPDLVVIHGDAIGADFCAKMWAKATGTPHIEYEADWEKYGLAAGPIRNGEMLKKGKPDLVLAFPERDSKGTLDCIKQAKAMGLKVIIHGDSS